MKQEWQRKEEKYIQQVAATAPSVKVGNGVRCQFIYMSAKMGSDDEFNWFIVRLPRRLKKSEIMQVISEAFKNAF